MKKLFANNAGVIGLGSTAAFAVTIFWYSPHSDAQVPILVYGIGLFAIALMSYSLWASLQ